MGEILNLKNIRDRFGFDTRLDVYIDGAGHTSIMRWIPPFTAYRALTAAAAVATPSGTIGDWLLPADLPSGMAINVDYASHQMGGYWVDQYLCSSFDASTVSMGTVAAGSAAYVSQPGVAPRVVQNIVHYKTYLANRFSSGGFTGGAGTGHAGKGGLMTDAHWFELWVWTRIHRHFLHGNTNGYNNSQPRWDGDITEIGILDKAQTTLFGANITGGGPKSWDIPISDFSGNRWEFCDGLRLFNGAIYTSGKTINPPASYADVAYTATGLIIGISSTGGSVSSYRTEAAIAPHGIPKTTTVAGAGPMDGQGFWFNSVGERISRRGGGCTDGAQCPGALHLNNAPAVAGWYVGARAVLVP